MTRADGSNARDHGEIWLRDGNVAQARVAPRAEDEKAVYRMLGWREGSFVFAPSDEAFAKIPKADLDALLRDKAKLTAVLTYHVFTANVSSADLKAMKDFGTAQGGRVTIDASKGLKINGANVVKADVPASNGVIHVFDTVLIPK